MNENKFVGLYHEIADCSMNGVVLAGNECCTQLIANHIPEEEQDKAMRDIVKMQLAGNSFKHLICSVGLPESKEEVSEKLNGLLTGVLAEYLKGYSATEQHGVLIQGLNKIADYMGEPLKPEEQMEMTQTSIEELKKRMIENVKGLTVKILTGEEVQTILQDMENGEEVQATISGKEISASAMAAAAYMSGEELRKDPGLLARISTAAEIVLQKLDADSWDEDMETALIYFGFLILFLTAAVILNLLCAYGFAEVLSMVVFNEAVEMGVAEFLEVLLIEMKLAVPEIVGLVSMAVGSILAWVKEGIFEKDYFKNKALEQNPSTSTNNIVEAEPAAPSVDEPEWEHEAEGRWAFEDEDESEDEDEHEDA